MKTTLPLLLALLACAARADNEVGFIEKFALAADRAAVLTQLIPGSEDYYFYHALHFQNTGQKPQLAATMDQWKKRFPESQQRTVIENREALLAYDADPKTTLQFLRDRLKLEFNHEQQARDRKPDLPAVLDQARISREAFRAEALRDSDDLAHVSEVGLESLVREKVPLNPAQKRALLSKLKRPDLAGLVELIEADLKTEESKGFGEFEVHRALLPEQLDELAKRNPTLFDSQAFVHARLRKMWPGPEADAEFDPKEREAWLDRTWAYAKNLGPAFNTLKAHILYARLQHDRTRGLYDKARLIEYLKLPRRMGYMRGDYINKVLATAPEVDLNANLSEVLVAVPPIGSDEWLVREYLLHLFKTEPRWEPWAVWLHDAWVKQVFAEAKIVHGIGNPEQWAALLDPTAFQRLKERVDIDFSPANPQFHAPADDVALDLFVKNAPKLIVKIYEINTLSFFLTQNRQLNTDINLDGLVANTERTVELAAAANPFRRLAQALPLPELKGRRGAWIVELIGAGKSSRVLIRKGQWHVLQRTGPAGDVLHVVDEAHQPVPDAVVWVEGRKLTAAPPAGVPDPMKAGIVVPFTNQPGNKPLILADASGEFATLTSFEHHAESYTLDAQFHIPREQLLAGKQAILAVRAALLLNDAQVAPTLLHEPKLTITSTTLDGVSTTSEVTAVKLDPAKVFTHTFTVPARLARLEVEISARVDKLSAGGEKQDLSSADSWEVNGIDATEATQDGHLSNVAGEYVFELLGKNAEPLADMQVVFRFRRDDFTRHVEVPLRTDERGRVALGTLTDINEVDAELGTTIGSVGGSYPAVEAKLRDTLIPRLEFREATLREAIEYLKRKATPLDFELNDHVAESVDARITLSLTNSPVRQALEYVTQLAGVKFRVGPSGVIIGANSGSGRYASRQWRLQDDSAVHATAIHAQAGEIIRVPWFGAAAPGRDEISLLEKRADSFVVDRFAAVSTGAGFLEIKGLAPGDYSVRIARDQREIELRISGGKSALGWLLADARQLELRNAAPLQIEGARADAEVLVIQLRNADRFARVHVAATRFMEAEPLAALGDFSRFEPGLANPAKRPNLYAAGRAIGDEFRYILERRYAQKFPGNMLTRPGLLLNPWEVRTTDLAAQAMAGGQAPARSAGDRERKAKAPAKADDESQVMQSVAETVERGPNLDFLATAAPAIFNLVPDAQGVVRIERKLLGDRQHVQLYAEDLHSAVFRSFALPEVPTKFQDLRLARNLDPQKHFTERKQVTIVPAGQTLTLPDILTNELETYDSLAAVHALFATLSSNDTLAKFAWILQWPKLSAEEKRAKYSEFACHELHFFLSRKDPAFFAEVIQPYLRNKKDKTFMDEYLLGADLKRFVEPWQHARLNVVERALLAQRLGGGEPAATARHFRELLDLQPPDPDREDQLFETALRGKSMQEGGEFAGAKVVAETAAPAIPGLEPLPGAAPASPADAAPPAPKQSMAGVAGSIATLAKDVALRGVEQQESLALGEVDELQEGVKAGSKVERRAGRELQDMDGVARNDFYALGLEANVEQVRRQMRQFFRALGPTKEWAENNYYKLPIAQQNAELVKINPFWSDFAAWDGKAPFLSKHVAHASSNFTEMMLALAVLDLLFEPGKHTTKAEGGQFSITAATPLIAFHKEIKPAEPAPAEQGELLVTENFFRHGDRHRMEGNEKFDKYVTEEFLVGVGYGGNVVVTNPTSSPQKLDVLLQIPRGALPVLGSKPTDSKRLALEPYTTKTLEYFFYFPAPNTGAEETFPHFPVHVARKELTAGVAKAFSFRVVKQLSKIDTASWDYVSQYGTDAEVFDFLEKNNLGHIDLERVAWRARKSVTFFCKIVALLEQRHVWSEPIYRYAIGYNLPDPLREWLRHREDFLAQTGPWLATKLLTIDPIERRAYEHLEYSPLVNQRAHLLGGEPRIPNPVFRGQYQSLLRILAHKPALDAIDQMSVVYYLFLQDRVEEALARFAAIQPETLPTRLQHDYFRCYAAFYQEKLADARAIAAAHAQHPVDRWRKLFAEVAAQLDDIEGKAAPRAADDKPNRELQQGALASTEPTLHFKIEDRGITLTYRNLPEVTVNYYPMDPEFLFSISPFVTQDSSRFAVIKPTKTERKPLPQGADAIIIPIPPEFERRNVLIEVLGAGQRQAEAYHANSLMLSLAENYGRLEVRDDPGNKPLPKTYVKVYARLKNGQVRYFKDGYTDLRGRFDYASLNSSEHSGDRPMPITRGGGDGTGGINHPMLAPQELGEVEKLAILILSDTHGALVREAAPPSE